MLRHAMGAWDASCKVIAIAQFNYQDHKLLLDRSLFLSSDELKGLLVALRLLYGLQQTSKAASCEATS